MFKVQKEIHFCYGHRLLAHPGKCKHIHGHNVRAIITVAAENLDEQGMVIDFSTIDKTLKPWIDEQLDHNFLLLESDPLIPLLEKNGERFFTMKTPPTAENIAKLIYDHATKTAKLPIESVVLWESFTAAAHYCE
jgi:6-pyruvoyltetrahydropterin/6-carboxytetrahydropterin synthase